MFKEYTLAVAKYLAKHQNIRTGQAYANVLSEMHPSLSEMINGTDLDPFYKNDDELDSFFAWMYNKLNS